MSYTYTPPPDTGAHAWDRLIGITHNWWLFWRNYRQMWTVSHLERKTLSFPSLSQIQLEIAYAPAFNPLAVPIKLKNLVFEHASMLFNLAALYSQLSAAEDRSTTDGIKRAAVNYQVRFLIHSSQIPYPSILLFSKPPGHSPFCVQQSCRSSFILQMTRCYL